jgi:cation diffusion facilitator CzcD-associated flavoprotein CzcO
MHHETTHRIVILGGGFGGVFTAKRLRRYAGSRVEVVLISRHNFFVFTLRSACIHTPVLDGCGSAAPRESGRSRHPATERLRHFRA